MAWSTLPWVIPYLVLPLGEYVLEIVLALRPRLADVDEPGAPGVQLRDYPALIMLESLCGAAVGGPTRFT